MKQYRDCYDEQDDASLVASVLVGKREAFDILLQRHSSSVFHLCTRLLGNTFEAQDIAQEAALQAFLGLSRLQEPARFAAWFQAIAANLARSALRRHREQSLQILGDDDISQMFWIDAPPTLEEYQIEKELQETVTRALQSLSETNRQAVIGFYLQGYSYEELAQLLDVPVSTVKGRLFQGRQRLKTLLRPLAETHSRVVKKQRKEQNMSTSTMVELEVFAVHLLLLTQQHVAVLRDPQTERGFAVRLSAAESDALITSFGIRQNKDAWPFLQDLSQRLLESMGAQLQRVTINTLAGQSLYATLTLEQEGQKHEVDARLSEVLALAVRTGTPLFIARSLFDTAATLDLTATAEARSWQELETRGKDIQKQGREERLRLEEDVRGIVAPRGHLRPSTLPERLWAWLLEGLTGSQNGISVAELRVLDLATALPIREVTWDEQPMIAIRLPDQARDVLPHQRETAWTLVRPEIWEGITHMVQRLQKPEHNEADKAPTPPMADPFPDGLPLQIQQRVEERLAWLIEEPELRTAFLLNPQGTVAIWRGADTEETVQRFGKKLFSDHQSMHTPLANADELQRQLGDQPHKGVPASGNKKALRQDLPKEAGGIIGTGVHPGGWQMVVIFEGKNARDLKEETHQRLQQARKDLREILTGL